MTCIEGTLSLLDFAEDTQRARLLDSPLGGLLPGEKVADLFCGAGGWGEGAKMLGITVDFAVNHDPVAIAAHTANNPGCRHHRGDAWRTKPREVVGDAKLGLLLASAACTTHSRARGSAPISQRVHMLGWCISRWMHDVRPRVVMIENVPEWKDWGPTIVRPDGVRVQDPARKGQHFRRWWRYCVRLGYVMEMRVLDAPDYGEASRRRRLFIIARRDGQPICWPEKTHGPIEGDGENCADRNRRRRSDGSGRNAAFSVDDPRVRISPFRTAAECIDWSNLGSSIFERERPLRPKTLGRICEGVRRFVLNDPSPFVLRVSQPHAPGGGWHVYAADGPLPTQTVRADMALCTPIVAPQNGGVYGQRPDEAGPTITTKGHQALISPIMATTGYGEREGQAARVAQVADLLGTCVNGVKQAVVSPVMMPCGGPSREPSRVDDPMHTLLIRDDRALCTPVMMVNTTHHTGGRVDAPVSTITTGGQASLVSPVMAYLNHGGKQTGTVNEPLRTVVSGGGHAMLVAALMMEYYGNSSSCRRPDGALGAVTTVDRHGLVSCVIDGVTWTIVDILFRMLQPHELAKAMGFPDEYQGPKTKRESVRLIGNAVSVRTSRALVGAVFPRGRIGDGRAERGAVG